ncbi:hypothetical protein QQS21_009024 [Conoideocrella luteorostrata]|uniref:Aminoglycoside phosphotransferase domain-containing protein n=1 Tax=Conoideocrella luteorostrata TaxID=1105319 RepID=A0AAJ0CHV3_9HYPO|nr:hypothetical protein QQS21_009024 [Conoideocrella luteorostrata]
MTAMTPFEANPAKIPSSDRYNDVPFYGRYFPQPDDFTPDPKHINSNTSESIGYWLSVLSRCNVSHRIYENGTGGRDVFAFGKVIIKSAHLKHCDGRDYTLADANEVAATAVARTVLGDILVPRIYFADKLNGRCVLVQERIPGVGLNVAWQYLSSQEKESFKDQARDILQKLHTVKLPANTESGPSYVVPDPDPMSNRGIQRLERDIIFSTHAVAGKQLDRSFMHNDLTQSNCIANNGKIVAVVDWEMAGFFGWETARDVHVRIRSPRQENYAHLKLPESFLKDILYWNDLYEEQP